MKGSAGSGKSVDTAQQYIIRLLSEKGRNLLCVRKSETSNRDSVYAELLSAINRMGLNKYFKDTKTPLSIVCLLNGNEVIFRGVNDEKQREKLKSITFQYGKLTDVWIEEATELSQQDFEIIDDRLRGDLSDNLFYQIKMTFNPVSANHWIKKAFFDRKDEHVLSHHSTYLDNRFIGEAYHKRMARRQEIDPEGYRIYGLGQWGEIGGLILTNVSIHEFEREELYFDTVVYGQDFGFNHANAILDIGFKDGEIYVCDEIYVHEMDTGEIIRLTEKYGFDKRRIMYCDSAEPDRIKMWADAGFFARPVKKEPNSVLAQIDYLKQTKIHIHPRCVHAVKEIGQWKWKFDPVTNQYLDTPADVFDDAMAALRYAVEEKRRRNRASVADYRDWGIW